MQSFAEWIRIIEQRQELVSRAVLDGYERGFREALKQLLGRVRDPVLRAKFQRMLECPIKDSQGRCQSFTDYIVSALVRHQIHRVADIDDALSYCYETMMLDKKINGEPKSTVFGAFNFDRPAGGGNPLEARFKTAVGNAIRNIASGRIRRLLHTPSGTVSAENIPSRTSHDQAFGELIRDISSLLARKEKETELPLIGIFHSMIDGESTAEQRRLLGARGAVVGRQVVVQTIKDYARRSGNVALTQLLARIDQPNVVQAAQLPKAQPATASPKERDYISILSLVDKLGRPAGSADFGRFRRRWLEYSPRGDGVHRNRLEEVLHSMVKDGVLKTVKTGRGAIAYLPGENAEAYRRAETAA